MIRERYFDHNATTEVAPEVIEVMVNALRDGWGNPSSGHRWAAAARVFVERARSQVADLIGAEPDEIVFTSGGTEADDLAVHGTPAGVVVSSPIEHPAITAALAGRTVHLLDVGRDGRVVVPERLPPDTSFVTVMLANNETGVLQPVAELAALASVDTVVHTDAAQAVGKIPVDVRALGVDLLTIAGHKLYAPKGIGALYVRRGTPVVPRLLGGGQQGGLRAGTEPVPGIAALGEACRLAGALLATEGPRQEALRDRLATLLVGRVPGLVVTGMGVPRLPNTLHVRFPETTGREVLARAPTVVAATGSACHAGRDHPSAVLLAMGIAVDDALGAVRLSIGRSTTERDVEFAAEQLGNAWVGARHG